MKFSIQKSIVYYLRFALSMTFVNGPKGPLDFSVFSASVAAFALFLIEKEERT